MRRGVKRAFDSQLSNQRECLILGYQTLVLRVYQLPPKSTEFFTDFFSFWELAEEFAEYFSNILIAIVFTNYFIFYEEPKFKSSLFFNFIAKFIKLRK